ncbi:hypothetical protein ACWPKO_29770 (plasmid) [Coraliomargarita sp. W4R53]
MNLIAKITFGIAGLALVGLVALAVPTIVSLVSPTTSSTTFQMGDGLPTTG